MPRPYLLERVDEAAVVQVYADGFDELSRREKTLVWHLTRAAIAGRDIFWDQRYRHNLDVRRLVEELLRHAAAIDPAVAAELRRYAKLCWINTGPYNNLTARKFLLRVPPAVFGRAVAAAVRAGARVPLAPGETLDAFLLRLAPVLFDATIDSSVTCKTPPPGSDVLTASANNLYAGVSLADLHGFDERYALNSRLVRENGHLVEEVYRVGGRYGREIAAVVGHLEAAIPFAPDPTARALRRLVQFYRSGEEADRRAYDIAWLDDADAPIDTINGFIEVYMDPRGRKGAWEALVWFVNREKTDRVARIARAAQWFEDHMPYDPRYRRPTVTGVTARAIEVVVETGDAGPMTPIGINLPNDESIRERYGSKSVSLANIVESYDRSTPPEYWREFSWTAEEAARAERWSTFAGELTTALHEVIGHGSGRLSPRLQGEPQKALREHYSALEETRADLVALYFIADPIMSELGLIPADRAADVVLAEYEAYARNALVQLRRVREGNVLEEDHMRNRQAIVHWLMSNAAAVEPRRRDGKTFYVVIDAVAFRQGAGRLLAEVQRMKSEGEYDAACAFFERYGVRFDPSLRDEIVARVDRLNLPSYTGVVMPELEAERGATGDIVDVRISYPLDLEQQMMAWGAAE